MQSGCKSFNILVNMGYIIILLSVFLVFVLILGVVFQVLKNKRDLIKRKIKAAKKQFFWNGFIKSTNLTYLKSFVSFALASKLLSTSEDLRFDASLLVTILLGSQLLIQPFFVGTFMIKNRRRFKEKEFKLKYESLFAELKVKKYLQLLYPMIFFLRRAIFVILATMQDAYPYFQIQFLNLFNCFHFMYLGYVQPQKTRKSNRIELLNEFTVQTLCYHLF